MDRGETAAGRKKTLLTLSPARGEVKVQGAADTSNDTNGQKKIGFHFY